MSSVAQTEKSGSVRGIVFLDRDGVLNVDSPDFIKSVAEWKPIPGSLEAVVRLSLAGFHVVVVTNQSGVARGLIPGGALDAIHALLRERVQALGGHIAGIYHCPHAPEDGCRCRKPDIELIRRAEADLGLEAAGAPFVGDRMTDLEAARRAGCRPVFVRGSSAPPDELASSHWADVRVFCDLARAADWLLASPNSAP